MSIKHAAMSSLRSIRGRNGAVAFLTYHRVGQYDRDEAGLAVSAEVFSRQVEHFAKTYTLLTAGEAYSRIAQGKALPSQGIVITVDDGYADTATSIAPILRTHQAPATFFVTAGLLDEPVASADAQWQARVTAQIAANNAYQPERGGQPDSLALMPSQISDLHRDELFEIGAHGFSHSNLAMLDDASLERDVRDATALLASITGQAPVSFCYPYGTRDAYSARTKAVLQAHGYLGACTTTLGKSLPWGLLFSGSDRFETPRIATNQITTEQLIERIERLFAE